MGRGPPAEANLLCARSLPSAPWLAAPGCAAWRRGGGGGRCAPGVHGDTRKQWRPAHRAAR
eukprot:465541-Alexandrium_andersonii.AAC.1